MAMIVTVFVLAASAAASPVQAGPPDTIRPPAPPARVEASPPPPPLRRQIDKAAETVDRADRLRRVDARRAKREIAQMRDLTDRYAGNGLSDAERREIETRAEVMRSIVNAPAGPGQRRP